MLMMNPCISLAGDLASSLSPVTFQQRELVKVLPALDAWQKTACRANAPGLLLLCGRQTGKSTFAALLATWMVTTWPDSLVLLISPTLRQSTELFRKCMALFDGCAGAPDIKARSKTELVLKNKSSIVSLPGANPDAIRGYSAPDLIIEDEAAFVNDRTFVASRPMLATSAGGRHVLLTTPYGRRGHFYDLWASDDPGWQRIAIKSSECERITGRFLDGERRVLSDRAYRQEYECEFLEAANAVFPADILERLTDGDERRVIMPDEATRIPSGPELEAGIDRILHGSGIYANLDGPAPPAADPSAPAPAEPRSCASRPKADRMALFGEHCDLSKQLIAAKADETMGAGQRANRIADLQGKIAELEKHPDFPGKERPAAQDDVARSGTSPDAVTRSEAAHDAERGLDRISVPADRYANI